MLDFDVNPQLDEDVGKAWIQKNEALDKARFAERLRVIAPVATLLGSIALIWKFAA